MPIYQVAEDRGSPSVSDRGNGVLGLTRVYHINATEDPAATSPVETHEPGPLTILDLPGVPQIGDYYLYKTDESSFALRVVGRTITRVRGKHTQWRLAVEYATRGADDGYAWGNQTKMVAFLGDGTWDGDPKLARNTGSWLDEPPELSVIFNVETEQSEYVYEFDPDDPTLSDPTYLSNSAGDMMEGQEIYKSVLTIKIVRNFEQFDPNHAMTYLNSIHHAYGEGPGFAPVPFKLFKDPWTDQRYRGWKQTSFNPHTIKLTNITAFNSLRGPTVLGGGAPNNPVDKIWVWRVGIEFEIKYDDAFYASPYHGHRSEQEQAGPAAKITEDPPDDPSLGKTGRQMISDSKADKQYPQKIPLSEGGALRPTSDPGQRVPVPKKYIQYRPLDFNNPPPAGLLSDLPFNVPAP